MGYQQSFSLAQFLRKPQCLTFLTRAASQPHGIRAELFHSVNSPDNSPLSHFLFPVQFLPYWYFQLYTSLLKSPSAPRSGELRTQKLKSHLVRTQSLNVLPVKPGVGQYIAVHATLTARDFFLAYFYTSGPFTCNFSKTSLKSFPVLAVANTWFLCRPAE